MALIFFEGFNRTFDNTDPAAGYAGKWEWATVESLTPTFGYTSTVRNGSGSLYLPTNQGAGNSLQCYADLTISAQSNKTLYLGFAVYTMYTGYDSATTGPQYAATLLRFYNALGAEQFKLDLDRTPSASGTIGFAFKNSAGVIQGSPLILSGATDNASYSQARQYGYVSNSNWAYVELKITLNSSTSGSVEARVDGLALQTSSNSATVALPTISNIHKIRFCANETGDTHIDDLYLLDNSGGSLDTWLGPTTKVFSPTLSTTNSDVTTTTEQEWDTVGSLSLDSYNPDGDYITTKLTDRLQLYVLASADGLFSIPAVETVAAVQVRSIARETSLPAAYKQVFKTNTAGTVTNLSSELQTEAYYQSAATILTTNPVTSAAWTLTDLETAHFGIKSVTRTV
jgi:hypothetical protein